MSTNVAILVLIVVVFGLMGVWLRPRREGWTRPARALDEPPGGAAAKLARSWKRPTAPDFLPALPPDPQRSWTSEIEWRQTDRGARFSVVCRSPEAGDAAVTIAESQPLVWPPTGPASIQALTVAAARLEGSLVATGWTPLPPGGAWYAKRFAWQSAPIPPEPASDDAVGQEALGQFAPHPAWPEPAEGLWRCEISWDAGWAESRFQAVAYRPHGRRGRPIAASSPLRWLLMGPPDPAQAEHRDAVHGLASKLEAAGWEPVGRGLSWYSRRFSWTRDGAPSDPATVRAPAPAPEHAYGALAAQVRELVGRRRPRAYWTQ
jgi:hypothetical protein